MVKSFSQAAKHRLTASVIASHFKHRCDRLFRYNTVPGALRERPGIGWRVPKKARQHTRPGAALLMQGGDIFEVSQINRLIDLHGAAAIHHAGIDSATNKVIATSFADFLVLLDGGTTARFFAQIDLDFETGFTPDVQQTFLQQFNLDPDQIQLTKALPDLIEIVPARSAGEPTRLRIWDFKASRKPRHEHYIHYCWSMCYVMRTGMTSLLIQKQRSYNRDKMKMSLN